MPIDFQTPLQAIQQEINNIPATDGRFTRHSFLFYRDASTRHSANLSAAISGGNYELATSHLNALNNALSKDARTNLKGTITNLRQDLVDAMTPGADLPLATM